MKKFIPIVFLCLGIFTTSQAQTCEPPTIVFNANSGNLFSTEQEMIFGELIIQHRLSEMRFINDAKLLAYVEEMGELIAKHLPQTGLKLRIHIVDIPEANAFSIPGGHVMISRKLIAFAASGDELAGVIAHEFGHAVVRHSTKHISEALSKILKIKTLGDRKDIIEKYNLLIEQVRTNSISRKSGHENKEQLEADRIGLHAMVAASYDPTAFSSFFDRLAETKGNIGNWFTDLFGGIPPDQKRLREIVQSTDKIPPSCRDKSTATSNENFLKWQADVVTFRDISKQEVLPGLLWKKDLAPKLRSDVSHLSFSNDGKYLLAQDDFAITIIERDPLRMNFQISTESANKAAFTPDGKFIIFTTKNLSYEKWSIAEKKPVEVRELTLKGKCWENKLSPDGNYLACVDTSLKPNILETKTGKKIWEKKDFYQLSFLELISWLLAKNRSETSDTSFFFIEFSPDSRYVMFSRSNKYRFRYSINSLTAAESENTALAFDLINLKPVEVGKNLKKLSARSFFFLSSEKILGMPTRKVEESGVFSFPDGKQLEKISFFGREIQSTANSDYIIIKPMAKAKLGIFDVKKQIVVTGMNKLDATIWNNILAFESINGKIRFQEILYNEAKKNIDQKDIGDIDIPVTSVKNLETAELSNNFKWILYSSKTRGGLWALESGERKFHVRGFRGGIIDDTGVALVDFPKLDETPRSIVMMNPQKSDEPQLFATIDKETSQHGRFILKRRSLKEIDKKEKKQISPDANTEDVESDSLDLHHNVKFELIGIVKNKITWSQDFVKEAPQFSFDQFSGRMILFWRLQSDAGKAKLKESVELQNKTAALGDMFNDYLIEIIDAFEQKVVGSILLDTRNGSFFIKNGISERDWLLLYDTQGRVLVYSIKEGKLRHRFFGNHAAINPNQNQIVVENFPGEITLLDLTSGDSKTKFFINGNASFIRFNLEGTKLFVLSNHQTAYCFDLTKQ